MKANQTTATATANRYTVARPDLIKSHNEPTAPKAEKQTTTERLADLMSHRNELLQAVEMLHALKTNGTTNRAIEHATQRLPQVVHELAETIAQIAVYKTLDRLSDSPKDITTSGVEMCEKLRKSFSVDMMIYRHNDTTQNYSDAFDLFNIAYMQVWQYLNTPAPLALDDIVLTEVKKNGNEKNYTIFQTACKSIREYIHSWSKGDQYKKLHYIIGIADNGQAVTSSKRPTDKLEDITDQQKTAFFTAHGLTAREQEIISLYIKGEKAETIATLLNLNLRMVQRDIKNAKSKFTTANAYAEYITARNAEKIARAKAVKNPTDSTYQRIWKATEERTAKAYTEWKNAFKKENRHQWKKSL